MESDGQQQQPTTTVLVTRPGEKAAATPHYTTTPVVPFSAPDPDNNDQSAKLLHLIHKIKQNKRQLLIVLVVVLIILVIIFIILTISLWSASYSVVIAAPVKTENLPIEESITVSSPTHSSVQSNDVFHIGDDENVHNRVTASDIDRPQQQHNSIIRSSSYVTANFYLNPTTEMSTSVKIARTGDFNSGYFNPSSSNFETIRISSSSSIFTISTATDTGSFSEPSITSTLINNIAPLLPANVPKSFVSCDLKREFRCSDDKCIRKTLRCNKKRDCSNGIDEKNCSCVDYLRTLSPNKICDGYPDCPKYEDEANCSVDCAGNEFLCRLNGECIPIFQRCDGKLDCLDGDDESNCWTVSPSLSALLDSKNPHRSNHGYPFWMAAGRWNMICSDTPVADSVADKLCRKSGYQSAVLNEVRQHEFENISTFLHLHPHMYESYFHKVSYSCPSKNSPYFVCSGFTECSQRPMCQPNRKRIVGGRTTGPDCHPWTAALYKNGQLTCHAIVLTHTWLLTAAHCMAQ